MHFQLRNLVWATSKHDVYVMARNAVHHWSPLTRRATEVLNLDRPRNGASKVQISTTCVHQDLLVVGGFRGELVAKRLSQPELTCATRIAHDDSAITNAVEVTPPSGERARSSHLSLIRLLLRVSSFGLQTMSGGLVAGGAAFELRQEVSASAKEISYGHAGSAGHR